MEISENKKIYTTIAIICYIIVITARIFNFGWLLFYIIPFGTVHFTIFLILSHKLSKIKNINTKSFFVILCITYLMGYILLPDFLDTSDSTRMVFGIIRGNDLLIKSGLKIALLSILMNVVLIIYGLIEFRPEKNNKKNNEENNEKNNEENNEKKKINSLCLLSLIFSVVGSVFRKFMIFEIIAMIFGIIGTKKFDPEKEIGKKAGMMGMVISWMVILFTITCIIIYLFLHLHLFLQANI